MKKDLKCLRCNTLMRSMGIESFQLGQTGLFSSKLDDLLAGTLEVEILVCPACHKLEFYAHSGEIRQSDGQPHLAQVEPDAKGAPEPPAPFDGYRTRKPHTASRRCAPAVRPKKAVR